MFTEMEKRLDKIISELGTTNKLLAQIEVNLRVPSMIYWSKILKEAEDKL